MNERKLGLTQAYISVILMGIGITVIQTLPIPAQTLVWYRVAIAAPGLALYALLSKQPLYVPRNMRNSLFWAALLTGGHWVTLFISITMSTVAIGMISFYCFPVFTTLFEAALQRRKPAARDLGVAALVLVGVTLLTPITGASIELLPGVLIGVFSGILWAGRMVVIRHRLKEISGLATMFWSMVVMMVFLSPFLIQAPPPWQWEGSVIRGVLFLGLFVTAFCHTLLLSSLRHISATLVGQISPIQIVSASLAGWLFLKEPLTLRILAGGLLIACTGFVVARFFKEPSVDP
ncbi:DMT family transporter [Kiritimatiellaeota bacterium B1221]|nr:DMT family transporter [Kiritimatiellaeota bacterium B1221]